MNARGIGRQRSQGGPEVRATGDGFLNESDLFRKGTKGMKFRQNCEPCPDPGLGTLRGSLVHVC